MTEAEPRGRVEADVAVVGAGPAGIAAACAAAEAGKSVLLLDENPAPGGQIWRGAGEGKGPTASRSWIWRLARSGARMIPGAVVVDAPGPGRLLVEKDDKALQVVAGNLVLATGARELYLPYPGWTLPNVFGVGAGQALLKSGVSFAGARVVVAGAGPLLLPVAATLADAGAEIAVVAEQAPPREVRRFALYCLARHPGRIFEAARYRLRFVESRYETGVWVNEATGDDRVREVVLTDGGRTRREACDFLLASYGLVPNLELHRLLGCGVDGGAVVVDERQQTSVPGVFAAGEPTGIGGVDLSLAEGEIAGLAAAGVVEIPSAAARARRRYRGFAEVVSRVFTPRRELMERIREETTVCRCEDVPWSRLDPTWGMRQAKLYARAGMGPCQGRICGPALGWLHGWSDDRVRPPAKPCRAGTLAKAPPREVVLLEEIGDAVEDGTAGRSGPSP